MRRGADGCEVIVPCSCICPDEETCVFMALSGRTGSHERLGARDEVSFDGWVFCEGRGGEVV